MSSTPLGDSAYGGQRVTIYKQFMFEASHVLPRHPGQCSRLHGHSWKLHVGVSGPINKETGFVCDYAVLSELIKAHIILRVDHQHLGQGNPVLTADSEGNHIVAHPAPFGPAFYPSSENLVMAFVRILKPLVQELGEPERVLASRLKPGQTIFPGAVLESEDFEQIIPASIQLEEVSLDETCTSKCTWRRSNG